MLKSTSDNSPTTQRKHSHNAVFLYITITESLSFKITVSDFEGGNLRYTKSHFLEFLRRPKTQLMEAEYGRK